MLSEQSTLAAKAASASQWGGSAAAILGGINSNWVAAIGGILIGIAGLLMNWWFKHEHLKIARKAAAKVSALGEGD